MLMLSLLFLAYMPSNIEAFSSAPYSLSRRRTPCSPSTIQAATLENITEEEPAESPFLPTASAADGVLLLEPLSQHVNSIITSSESLFTSITDVTTNAIQSRSFDKDAIINYSVFIITIAIVLEHIFSVDIGITRGFTPIEIAERIALDNWHSYTHILSTAPIQTKAVTSATVYTIGDIIAQRQQGTEVGKLDRWRILRSLAAGGIGHGPMSHVWYHLSDDLFENFLHLHAWWDFLPKIAVDQLVFGPIWNNSYILLLGAMQLQKPEQIWEDMKRTTIPLMVSGLKLWPFVHCITYGLIPVENRLLWVDAVEILWVTILAGEASGDSDKDVDVGADSLAAVETNDGSLR
mmetsp:Transcript_16933/g.27512  ORF Transcript_16933/g.27512 Transcript_16933/m.27512 type:complete len:349 (+) Transcript_16933:314-1360(+)